MSELNGPWFVYMVRCADNSLYTGITTDIERREKEHNSKKGMAARYTRVRQPVSMVYQESCEDRSAAAKREWAIKQLNKRQKELLVTQG